MVDSGGPRRRDLRRPGTVPPGAPDPVTRSNSVSETETDSRARGDAVADPDGVATSDFDPGPHEFALPHPVPGSAGQARATRRVAVPRAVALAISEPETLPQPDADSFAAKA